MREAAADPFKKFLVLLHRPLAATSRPESNRNSTTLERGERGRTQQGLMSWNPSSGHCSLLAPDNFRPSS